MTCGRRDRVAAERLKDGSGSAACDCTRQRPRRAATVDHPQRCRSTRPAARVSAPQGETPRKDPRFSPAPTRCRSPLGRPVALAAGVLRRTAEAGRDVRCSRSHGSRRSARRADARARSADSAGVQFAPKVNSPHPPPPRPHARVAPPVHPPSRSPSPPLAGGLHPPSQGSARPHPRGPHDPLQPP
jgi:hypothetical protein